jgi:hypothetical protein
MDDTVFIMKCRFLYQVASYSCKNGVNPHALVNNDIGFAEKLINE